MTLPDGFTLVSEVFDPASSDAHLQSLLTELDWEQQPFTIYGRTVAMPRLIAMYGPVGYRYSGVVHPPRALPRTLDRLRRRVEEVAGRPVQLSARESVSRWERFGGMAPRQRLRARRPARHRLGELRRDSSLRDP